MPHHAFLDIEYLAAGTPRQQAAYHVLHEHHILMKLARYTPILTGTFPISIDIPSSDLDIICCFDDAKLFMAALHQAFNRYEAFQLQRLSINGQDTVLANFMLDDFEIELFGQHTPTQLQPAYRHLLIEHHLLQQHGEPLRQQVISLKNLGYKTEPAFAIALQIAGDPYKALLQLANELL